MQKKLRIQFLLILDMLAIVFSYYISLWLRFDGVIEKQYLDIFIDSIFVIVVIKIIVFFVFKLYNSLCEYASVEELINIVIAVVVANVCVVSYLFFIQEHLPRSVYVLVAAFDICFTGAIRFLYRVIRRLKNNNVTSEKYRKKRILVVGAGAAGALVAKEFKYHSNIKAQIIGFIDDDLNKKGSLLNGYKVLGTTDEISAIVEQNTVDEIIIAIPSASKTVAKNILHVCSETGVKIKILPGVYELIDGKVSVNQIRDVQIEDLLGREQISLDNEAIEFYIKDKVVLVTGGGGSIGSELCRQLAKFKPQKLLILDIYENNIYDLQIELNRLYNSFGNKNELNMQVLIASVRDKNRLEMILKEHQPDVIFHAAAHKHVPLMEDNPCEAVKNNILGTFNLASLADQIGIKKFVLISTDKAVNPTNVMGATKRFCEIIVQAFAKKSETEFVMVRFGNVLGSNGSVIPLFKKQIAEGGPVTVTHREIIRYFMTIPEAAQLVLQAGAMAKGGEIFILDMGEPVKIYDLAKDLISLSGLILDVDIKIIFTGLRPGEKLYEELLLDAEGIQKTVHHKIYTAYPLNVDINDVIKKVEVLNDVAYKNNNYLLKETLKKYVPSFVENKVINEDYLNVKEKTNEQ